MKLSDIREILSERDLQLSKSLGQNFLHDQNQVRRIVAAAGIAPGEKILEIGPGLGPLTEVLLEGGAQVLAIEKDQRLFDYLRQRFDCHAQLPQMIPDTAATQDSDPLAPHSGERARERGSFEPSGTLSKCSQLQLLHDDALQYVKHHREWSGWKLVSNLPYSVASPILVELAQAENPPDRMVATLQIEVAQRIDAATGSEHYGILSLLLQLRYQSGGWFKIPASCFFPAPEVDSACLTLLRRPAPLLPPELHRVFTKIVKRGFSQRRKMMLKLLKQDWPADRLAMACEAVGLSPQIRAEAVSLKQYIALTEILARQEATLP